VITDYASLQNELKGNDGYLHRTDLDTKIPTFIQLAEKKLANQIRARKMEGTATLTTTPGVNYVALPLDYSSPKSLTVSGTTTAPLTLIGADTFNLYSANNTLGEPRYYKIQGDNLLLFPNPSSALSINLVYYQTLAALSSTNTTNWVLTKYPYVYLYGAMVEYATYANDSEQIQYNKTEFNNAIEDMWFNNALESFGGGPLIGTSDYIEGM
jgi:hypothetical protein